MNYDSLYQIKINSVESIISVGDFGLSDVKFDLLFDGKEIASGAALITDKLLEDKEFFKSQVIERHLERMEQLEAKNTPIKKGDVF